MKDNPSPLLLLLRALSKEQRQTLATACGDVQVQYLYQVAGGFRPNPSAALALAIEDASRVLAAEHGTPVVTVRDIVEWRHV